MKIHIISQSGKEWFQANPGFYLLQAHLCVACEHIIHTWTAEDAHLGVKYHDPLRIDKSYFMCPVCHDRIHINEMPKVLMNLKRLREEKDKEDKKNLRREQREYLKKINEPKTENCEVCLRPWDLKMTPVSDPQTLRIHRFNVCPSCRRMVPEEIQDDAYRKRWKAKVKNIFPDVGSRKR